MLLAAITIELLTPRDETFLQALVANAAASRHEPGCRQFQVAIAEDGASVFLFEVYDDREAFQTHRGTAHFLEYDRITRPLIRRKDIKTYTLVTPGEAGPGWRNWQTLRT